MQCDKEIFQFDKLDVNVFVLSMGFFGILQIKFKKGDDIKMMKNVFRVSIFRWIIVMICFINFNLQIEFFSGFEDDDLDDDVVLWKKQENKLGKMKYEKMVV